MQFNAVGYVLFWGIAIFGGMALKNNVRRFAGWNLFALIGVAVLAELVLFMVVTFIYSLTK